MEAVFFDGVEPEMRETAGAGASWKIGKAGLRLEYEWFEVAPEYDYDTNEFEEELDASAGFLSLSVAYSF